MKISQMIENLQSFMSEHGDLNCYYAVDDEGNDYHEVYYEPSLFYVNDYGNMFSSRDIEDEDPEDIAELKKVCVVN